MVDFAGWEMPVQYEGVIQEHMAVRSACGIFDVSHMGQIETRGEQALELLQRLLSNDVARIGFGASDAAAATSPGGPGTGGAQYALICREDGGVLDDVFTYRVGSERYLTVTNAANHGRDLEHFRREAEAFGGVEVIDGIEDWAMLAVQGPIARELVQAISEAPLPPRLHASTRRLLGAEVLVCGTGYTGEDGVELLCAPAHAGALWDELVRRGARPAGLGARDTLRLEACFHLYGHELSTERGPIEAGLGWCCREETNFIGAEAVRAVRERGPRERLIAFTIQGPGIAREGNAIVGGGEVTSGTLSPCLQVGIGMGYVPAERAQPGTGLQIDVRGKMRAAAVREKPLYRKAS
jgi:aminomethyltransferase